MRYPNTLRAIRIAKQATQSDVGLGTRLTQDRVRRLEKGKSEPTYDEARRLAAFFDVDPDTIFPPPHQPGA